MYAIIDIGSNTIRLNIYKIEDEKVILLLSKKNSAALASYIKKDNMLEAGIEKAVVVLKDFKFLLDHLGITNVYAFATAALRNIKNSQETVAEIISQTGIPIVVIEGEAEAELDFIGVAHSLDKSQGLMVDIGGASTELVIFDNHAIKKAISIPLGSLNMYNEHVKQILPTRQERKAIKQAVLAAVDNYEDLKNAEYSYMCGIGGTIRATGKLNNELFGLAANNMTIKSPNVKKMIKLLENDDEDNYLATESLDVLLKITPERVRTILPGMIILNTLVKKFNCKEICVSNEGIREGYLYTNVLNKAAEEKDKPNE